MGTRDHSTGEVGGGGGVAVVFALALVAFTHNSKKPSSQEKVS